MKKIVSIILVVLILSISVISVFADEIDTAQNLIDNEDLTGKNWVIYKSSYSSYYALLTTTGDIYATNKDGKIYLYADESFRIKIYQGPTNEAYQTYEAGKAGVTLMCRVQGANASSIYLSNVDIINDSDSSVFFSGIKPPYQLEIQPQPLFQSVTQNLGILLPFGLGILSLMVFLAFLPRFLKRW